MVIERAKILLILPDQQPLDVTLLVDNWREWEVSIERSGINPSVKSTTFPFRFVKEARDILLTEFNAHMHNGEGEVEIYMVNSTLTGFEDVPLTYELDFATASVDDNFFSINCRTKSLRSIIKKYENEKYTFDVDEVKDKDPLTFTPVPLMNRVTYDIANLYNEDVGSPSGQTYNALAVGMSLGDVDVSNKDVITYNDVGTEGMHSSFAVPPIEPFLKVHKECTLHFELKLKAFKFAINLEAKNSTDLNVLVTAFTDTDPDPEAFRLRMVRIRKLSGLHYTYVSDVVNDVNFPWYVEEPRSLRMRAVSSSLSGREYDVIVKCVEGDEIYCWLDYFVPTIARRAVLNIGVVGTLGVSYEYRDSVSRTVDRISFDSVLSRLLTNMGATDFTVSGIRDDVSFVAAESLRNREGAKVHVSYNDLRSFLNSQGETLEVEGDEIKVTSYHGFPRYNPDETGEEEVLFSEDEVADLKVSIYDSLTFGGIRAGFSNSKIDGVNNEREINRLYNYTLLNNSQNILDLSTSIRADSVGFSQLALQGTSTKYVQIRDLFAIYTGGGSTPEMSQNGYFNHHFWAFGVVRGLDFLLRSSTDVALIDGSPFTDEGSKVFDNSTPTALWDKSSSQNKNVVFIKGGDSLYPTMYDLATSDNKQLLKRTPNTLKVRFTYDGVLHEGRVIEMRETPLRISQTEMKLVKWQHYPQPTYKAKYRLNKTKLNFPFMEDTQTLRIDVSGFTIGLGSTDVVVTIPQADTWLTIEEVRSFPAYNVLYVKLKSSPIITPAVSTSIRVEIKDDQTHQVQLDLSIPITRDPTPAPSIDVVESPITLSGNEAFTEGVVVFEAKGYTAVSWGVSVPSLATFGGDGDMFLQIFQSLGRGTKHDGVEVFVYVYAVIDSTSTLTKTINVGGQSKTYKLKFEK